MLSRDERDELLKAHSELRDAVEIHVTDLKIGTQAQHGSWAVVDAKFEELKKKIERAS